MNQISLILNYISKETDSYKIKMLREVFFNLINNHLTEILNHSIWLEKSLLTDLDTGLYVTKNNKDQINITKIFIMNKRFNYKNLNENGLFEIMTSVDFNNITGVIYHENFNINTLSVSKRINEDLSRDYFTIWTKHENTSSLNQLYYHHLNLNVLFKDLEKTFKNKNGLDVLSKIIFQLLKENKNLVIRLMVIPDYISTIDKDLNLSVPEIKKKILDTSFDSLDFVLNDEIVYTLHYRDLFK